MSHGRKIAIGGIVVTIVALWAGLLGAVALGFFGSDSGPAEPGAEVGFKDISFGPFLIVAPDSALRALSLSGTTPVTDERALAASSYYIELPATYTRTAIAGNAIDGEIVEVSSDWTGISGSHIHVAMTKVDTAALPIEIADADIQSHLLLQHKMLQGRYAIIQGPSLCSTELTGGSVTVWMNGATLTLSSAEASTPDLQNILGNVASIQSVQ